MTVWNSFALGEPETFTSTQELEFGAKDMKEVRHYFPCLSEVRVVPQ